MRGRPRQIDPLDEEPAPPEGYQGKWMTPQELRVRNADLARVGRRICRAHQGAALPLTDQYFYRTGWKDGFRHICIACKNKRTAERAKVRYHEDPNFVEHRKLLERSDRNRHIKARRAANAIRQRNYRRRLKRQRLATVLGEQFS